MHALEIFTPKYCAVQTEYTSAHIEVSILTNVFGYRVAICHELGPHITSSGARWSPDLPAMSFVLQP